MTSPTIEQMCRDLLNEAIESGVVRLNHEELIETVESPLELSASDIAGMANKLQTIIEAYTAGYDLLQKLRPLVWGKGQFWQCVAITGLQDPAGDPRGLRYYVDHRGDQFMYWIGLATKCYPCDSIDHGKRCCFADYQSRVRALFE